ncbi:hypothetical protein Patl1_25276 [Pistacia atlantica]|uniref:Uncharacterized protein n=1 Tax=Pistacia atlantica TaxID=434234 RepID=A0ACC1B176_9ROSI|nr:hypothetical protein Patl1_25276 [Pistacia atlantica]
MASQLLHSPRATAHQPKLPLRFTTTLLAHRQIDPRTGRTRVKVRALNGGDSYLDMWRNARDRERKDTEFQKIAETLVDSDGAGDDNNVGGEELDKKNEEFQKLLEVSKEDRDRIQRMQVIDRAAAAIAAARSLLEQKKESSVSSRSGGASSVVKSESSGANSGVQNESGGSNSVLKNETGGPIGVPQGGKTQGGTQNVSIFVPRSETSGKGTPGPDFWSWTPPQDSDGNLDDVNDLKMARRSTVYPSTNTVTEKTRSMDTLPIPFESKLSDTNRVPLPPFQSLIDVLKENVSEASPEAPSLKEEHELGALSSAHAAEAADALDKVDELSTQGVYPDGLRWWKETGIEQRPDGVICRWTMTRGVSADQKVEWQEKFWEAADELGYKELGSEKSGRDATGNVWREFWMESMRLESGIMHLEKTADKWGKNGIGEEWQEKWWEHYDASGQSEKWAHKWCSLDPNTPLDVGHAHVWHERWGEKYDGHGGSIKYTDKWAERCEGDGWAKWGDKWDENFDPNGHGVKQGETWWEGKYGDRWNRTWGEGHNGSGWVHKYGKSSSGEHWDTHQQQDTWYERFPHYGFYHCFDNSVQLREVRKPSEFVEP